MNIICIVVGIVVLILCVPIFVGDRKYRNAKSFEQRGKYKEACYEYAIAILNGTLTEKNCRTRIKYLWEKYGPFDYADVLEKTKKDDTLEKCGEAGHFATMSIIEKIVGRP